MRKSSVFREALPGLGTRPESPPSWLLESPRILGEEKESALERGWKGRPLRSRTGSFLPAVVAEGEPAARAPSPSAPAGESPSPGRWGESGKAVFAESWSLSEPAGLPRPSGLPRRTRRRESRLRLLQLSGVRRRRGGRGSTDGGGINGLLTIDCGLRLAEPCGQERKNPENLPSRRAWKIILREVVSMARRAKMQVHRSVEKVNPNLPSLAEKRSHLRALLSVVRGVGD